MTHPNVLYVVIDSLRADAIGAAETITRLAEENVSFDEAISPATWSLPAHASLLSGRYPHEHGVTRSGDEPDGLALVEALDDRGYTTYGVSGNPFFSQSQGFDDWFDRFWYTSRMWFPEGIDVSNHENALAKAVRGKGRERIEGIRDFIEVIGGQPNRLKSLGNVVYAAGLRLDPWERLGLDAMDLDIAHPFVDNSLAYNPETNTAIIENVLERESESGAPFFLFANYMDTHHPYSPPREFRRHIDGIENWTDAREINDEFSAWEFADGDVDDGRLETLRELYEGEVKSVDRHLGRLLAALDGADLREETVVIVTADHGENLGEPDHRGRRRIGHLASLSDTLVRVPLVVAHPSADGETIADPVSTKDVASAIVRDDLFGDNGIDATAVRPDNSVVLCEAPAKGGTETLVDNHPDAPMDMVEEETVEDNVLGRAGDWRAVRSSTGETWAWKGDEPVEYDSCPEKLRNPMEEAIEQLVAGDSKELSGSSIKRLKDLGYV